MITKEKVYLKALVSTVLILFLILILSTASASTGDYNSTYYEPVSSESVMEYSTPDISVECAPNNNENNNENNNSANEYTCDLSIEENSEDSIEITCSFTKTSGTTSSLQNSSKVLSPGEVTNIILNPGDNFPTGNTKVKVIDDIANNTNFYRVYVNNDGTINLPTRISEEDFNSDNEEDGTETDNRIEITIKAFDEIPEPILPVANFHSNVTSGYAPLSVQFTDLSENANEVSWDFGDGITSTDKSIIHTYSAAGTYTVNLTVSNENGTDSKTATINVLKSTPAITWSKPADIIYGTELNITQLNASASVPGTFVYTPAAGTVLSAGMQTLHVEFTPEDAENYNTVSKDVMINVLKATPVITWSKPEAIIYGTALNETQLNADASVPGSFVYDPVPGTILGAGDQTLQTTFTPANSTNYTTATGSVSLTVSKAAPSITWSNPADIVYGTPLSEIQLNASSSVDGTFVYTPSAGTVLSAGTQTLNVDFTPTDAENYTAPSMNAIINVLKATPEVTWNSPADIVYGTALNSDQLSASASVPGSFVYTPEAGTVLSSGTQTLHVEFTPEDALNYTVAPKNITINVSKSTPEVTWNNPADVIAGMELSSTQLNASASVPGTFVYIPSAGTVLSAGTQTLHVEFTPEDAENYNTVSKEVTINVLTPVQKIQQVTDTVEDLVASDVLNKGQGNALIVKLNAATKKLNTENTNAAINELNAFINQVNAYIKSEKLSSAQGQALIDDANSVINVLKTS